MGGITMLIINYYDEDDTCLYFASLPSWIEIVSIFFFVFAKLACVSTHILYLPFLDLKQTKQTVG